MQSEASAWAARPNATATTAPNVGIGAVLAVLNKAKDSLHVCLYCRGSRVQRWGHSGGVQRFRCRTCTRSFNALTSTPLARLRRRDLWLGYAQALNEGLSIRAAGRRLGIHYNTTFRWRHRWLIHPATCRDADFLGIVEVDTVAFVDVRDGEQPWRRVAIPPPVAERPGNRQQHLAEQRPTDQPHTPTGPQAPPDHRNHLQTKAGKAPPIEVLFARDRRGATTDAVLYALDQASIASLLGPILDASQTILCTPEPAVFARIASARHVAHYPVHANGTQDRGGIFHLANVHGYVRRLQGWMHRFLGVSARYLENYLGWRRLLDRHRTAVPTLLWLSLALGRDQLARVAEREAVAA
jgi:transposase-like protein